MQNSEEAKRQARMESERKRALVAEIQADFASRQQMRKTLERGWQLNMNFLSGNQYCDISPQGELQEEDAEFYWQSRACYNHIAPTVDTRLARLGKVRPSLNVRAFSDSEADIKTARLCSGILKSVKSHLNLDKVIARATLWSETCGTAFYKIVWNYDDGAILGSDDLGHPMKEGDVNVVALSPFEVYPDSLTATTMEEIKSIIHAKAVDVAEIKERFGVEIAGRNITDFVYSPYTSSSCWKRTEDREGIPSLENSEILIERYTKPNGNYPNGRLEIVAGNYLLYEGELPYRNGDRGARILPFVRQTCTELAGAFFGTSIVDRLIPLQRAYNAVRNRKHEFLNRLSMGVIAVEDGSLDAEELSEEGMYPGKVLVYRQGSSEPHFLDCGSIPAEFAEEEERITSEFIVVSGVSEISRNSSNPTSVTSATGLQLLIDQDTNRMQRSIENIDYAVKEIGKQILHLYKQFAATKRILRMTGTGGQVEVYYFDASEISADDIVFDTDYDRTPEQLKEEILSMLSLGLLQNEEGKLSNETRVKVLEALGYGSFENAKDISDLHMKKAEHENVQLMQTDVKADDYDDHTLHVGEHTRALLSGGEENAAFKQRTMRHINEHRRYLNQREENV